MTSLLLLFMELIQMKMNSWDICQQNLAAIIATYFIQNGGEIVCQGTGKRVHSKGPQEGLAIPCKLRWTSSNKKHVRRLDKLVATEKSKIILLMLIYCFGKLCIIMTSKLMFLLISRTPNFSRCFWSKKCGLYAGKYGKFF